MQEMGKQNSQLTNLNAMLQIINLCNTIKLIKQLS